MSHLRHAIPIYLALISTAAGAPLIVTGGGSGCTLQSDYCQGTNYNSSLLDQYICGDQRLGPVTLPRTVPLGFLVDIYDRFGGTCPGDFLETWYDPHGGWNGTGDWRWPPDSGFSLDVKGEEISANLTLTPGTLIDRFGFETGAFLSPAGAPFMQRSIPPDRLNIGTDARYVVTKLLQGNMLTATAIHIIITSTASFKTLQLRPDQ
jgi:hypothetical protein